MSDTVTSTLTYFEPPKDGARPYSYVNIEEATGKRRRNWTEVEKETQIINLRGKEDSVTLDTAGFQYFQHESAHKKFTDDEEIKKEYYPESEALLQKLTGAKRVVLFDHSMFSLACSHRVVLTFWQRFADTVQASQIRPPISVNL